MKWKYKGVMIMARISLLTAMFTCWIIVLLIEIVRFYNTIHEGHAPDDILFFIVLITITLVVVSAIVSPNKIH
jgi:hypothetical protein